MGAAQGINGWEQKVQSYITISKMGRYTGSPERPESCIWGKFGQFTKLQVYIYDAHALLAQEICRFHLILSI